MRVSGGRALLCSLFVAGLIAGVFVGYIIFAETGLFVSLSGKENYHLVEDGVVGGIDLQWFGSTGKGQPTSTNQMNKQVERGQAPKSVDRVDPGNEGTREQPHIHFIDGKILNGDGTWRDNGCPLTNQERDWIQNNGWTLP
jgi:hypothetical protein